MSSFRKTMDFLASELEALARTFADDSREAHRLGDSETGERHFGRSLGYATAAKKIRDAMVAS